MSKYIKEALLRTPQNKMRTNSLIYEFSNDKTHVVFVLADKDRHGMLSLHRLYMEIADPTEYEFAMQVFGSWKHWQLFTATKWFKPYLASWRMELEIKIRSDAIKQVIEKSRSEKGSNDAKWLAEKKWQIQRGRPTKEEVEWQRKVDAGLTEEVDEIYATIN